MKPDETPMSFKPSKKQEINQIIANLKPSIKESQKITIAPETCKVEFNEYFKCLICLQVVQDPQQCSQDRCDSLFCGVCITLWLKDHTDCPNCHDKFSPTKLINRFVMNSLNAYEFECETCSQSYLYEKAREHNKKCNLEYTCPLNCPGNLKFSSKDKIKNHLTNTCGVVNLWCSVCKNEESRMNLKSHDWCPM